MDVGQKGGAASASGPARGHIPSVLGEDLVAPTLQHHIPSFPHGSRTEPLGLSTLKLPLSLTS